MLILLIRGVQNSEKPAYIILTHSLGEYKIPNMVMVGIFFLWLERGTFQILLIPMEILHLKVSLVKFNFLSQEQEQQQEPPP